MVEKIKRGDRLLLFNANSHYLLRAGEKFGCNEGLIDLTKVVGKKYGFSVKSNKGVSFSVVKPTIKDFLFKASRGPQVVLPKDTAAIVGATGAAPGWRVVDAGSGSGFLSIFLANIGCDVTTYEKRKNFFEIASKNIRNSGLKMTIKNRDITKGFPEKDLDLITLDMERPERVIKRAYGALKHGGWLAVYSMHVEEVQAVLKTIKGGFFTEPQVFENLNLYWQSRKGKYLRPKTHLGHTGFLIVVRKL